MGKSLHCVFEESWATWEEATNDMLQVCEAAAKVWADIVAFVPMCLPCSGGSVAANPELVQSLVDIAATGLELELSDLHRSKDRPSTWLFLISILEVLGEVRALHLVGLTLLLENVTAMRRLPKEHIAVAVAVARCSDAAFVFAWLSQTGSVGQWLVWLVDCLIEALCEAAQNGDEAFVKKGLELCEALGGSQLANAVCGAGSRSSARLGSTPLQLAVASESVAVVELLSRWRARDAWSGTTAAKQASRPCEAGAKDTGIEDDTDSPAKKPLVDSHMVVGLLKSVFPS